MNERLLGIATAANVVATAVGFLERVVRAEGGAAVVLRRGSAREYWCSPQSAWSALPEETQRGLLEIALAEREPFGEPSAGELLSRRQLPSAPALRSLLGLPLRVQQRQLGALVLFNLACPQAMGRHLDEASPFALPVAHALARLELLEEQERATRLLEAILESANSHIAYLDRDFNFLRVNSLYEQGCGHSREELLGRNHFEFFPNEENQRIFAAARDHGRPVSFVERPFEYADQTDRGVTYWNWTLTPLKDERGEVEGLVLSLTDMTDSVRLRQRAVAAERDRADLAETVAVEINHRVKNNLAIVAGLLEMQARQYPEDSPVRSALQQATSRVYSIAAVHSQLYETRFEEIEVVGAIRRISDHIRESLTTRRLAIKVEGDPLFYPSKAATALCMVANELITNAAKYGAPGEGVEASGAARPTGRETGPAKQIQIKVRVALEKDALHLSVWNSGNPIAEDFNPAGFATVGLRLVREVVGGQHGGRLTLRPCRGGTLAEVWIPEAGLRRPDQGS